MKNEKALILLSGGLDSAVLLGSQKANYGEIIGLNISYGQRHNREVRAALAVASHYNIELMQLDLKQLFEGDTKCSLLKQNDDTPLPTGAYTAELPSTYVPYRNGLFLSAAAAVALSRGCSALMYGAHKDDAVGSAYPDCSEQFVYSQAETLVLGSAGKLDLRTPLLRLTKAKVVWLGAQHAVPFELTWSCYEGGDKPCGRCATCIDRAKAFAENDLEDLLICKSI